MPNMILPTHREICFILSRYDNLFVLSIHITKQILFSPFFFAITWVEQQAQKYLERDE